MEIFILSVFWMLVIVITETAQTGKKRSSCPEKPHWANWTLWSKCSGSRKNVGTKMRTRECVQSDCPDGSPCIGEWEQKRYCYSWRASRGWSEWSKCTSTDCRSLGTQMRKMKCIVKGTYPRASDYCAGMFKEHRYCYMSCCEEGTPTWAEWTSWTNCTPSCGLGTQKRTRQCVGSEKCLSHFYCRGEWKEIKICFTWCCDNVRLGQWSNWGPCRGACHGVSTRRRRCRPVGCRQSKNQCNGLSKVKRLCNERAPFFYSCRN